MRTILVITTLSLAACATDATPDHAVALSDAGRAVGLSAVSMAYPESGSPDIVLRDTRGRVGHAHVVFERAQEVRLDDGTTLAIPPELSNAHLDDTAQTENLLEAGGYAICISMVELPGLLHACISQDCPEANGIYTGACGGYVCRVSCSRLSPGA